MTRSRAGSRLSFRKSSSSSIPRVEASESPQDKRKLQFNGKADPTKAMNEAEPAAVATSQNTMSTSIRNLEHRDQDGNIIVDADRSNPTRPRLERPLDTIRSFEAAIDGSYNKRQSYRAETPNPMSPQTRRSSGYFNGYQPPRRGPSEASNYASDRMGAQRPDSYYDNGSSPSAAYYGGNNRRFGPRNHSDPALYGNNHNHGGQNGVYPSHGHHQSYDTVGASTNGSHEPWSNSTDPSSENSSIDKVQPPTKPDPGEAYGFSGFGGGPQFSGPILEEYSHGAPSYGQPGYGQSQMGNGHRVPHQANGGPRVPPHGGPAPPPKEGIPPPVPSKHSASTNSKSRRGDYSRPPPVADNEKRKSWLKKRFSRS